MGIFLISFILSIFFIVMMSIMIIFERDKPRNIIIYTIIFLFTQFLGYGAYWAIRVISNKKKNSLRVKQKEDEIYKNLSQKALTNVSANIQDELLNFNTLAFNADATVNNSYQFINSYASFKEDIVKAINKANKYVLLELTKVNALDFDEIKQALIAKANNCVVVKLVHEKNISSKLKKELKKGGIKVYKFSKHNAINGIYSNFRNVICIDGNIAYIGSLDRTKKQLSNKYDICDCFLKISGDVVQTISLDLHKDTVFASGKYLEFKKSEKSSVQNKSVVQYVSNEYNKDLELLIIKAISEAKSSIQIQVEEFIPTESIMSLLNFAINSNIDVKLVVPLKANRSSRIFATRAYAKELALLGANVYLYDGYVRFNSIIIDGTYTLFGNFLFDREHISTALQNIVIIKDDKAVNHFVKLLNESINNSYRISNANLMLLREKFFKNFV